MELLQVFVTPALIIFIYMNIWFLISLIMRRSDVADIAWGPGFLLIALIPFLYGNEIDNRIILTTFLVGLWAIRLCIHIYVRNKGKGEDYRYATWRESWGQWFYVRTYLQVFMLQGLLLLIVSSPLTIIGTYSTSPISLLNGFGIVLWVIGFLFETIGDMQLLRFIRNPENKGKIMRYGLWKYTRHPNYFGEITQWWAIWIISLSIPYAWIGIIGPITITTLILKVSGIPLLENKMAGNAEFEEYKQHTSVLFPLLPRP